MAEKKTGRPPNKPGDPDSVVRKAKWAAMKEEFLELTITGRTVFWPELAAKYGFSPQSARNKASQQKWYAEIETRRREREDILDKKLTERTSMALDELNRDFATSEVAIRKRHATMARGLQVRAIARIKDLKIETLSARDALTMLKMGLEEERFAMGMKQVFEGDLSTPEDPTYKPLVEQMGGHQRVQRVAGVMLKALQESGVIEEMEREQRNVEAQEDSVVDVQPKEPSKITIKKAPKP